MALPKRVTLKIKDSTGVVKTIYADTFAFTNFNSSIGTGQGSLQSVIPAKFDSDEFVDKGDIFEIWVSDQEARNGVLVYSGKVLDIRRRVAGSEYFGISCMGFIYELARGLHRNSTTIKFNYLSTEIGAIIEDVITKYNTNNADSPITYTTDSIASTGKNVTVKAYAQSPLDVIEQCLGFLDADWVGYLGPDNVFYLKEISTVPDHYFVMGRDVINLEYADSDKQKTTKYLFSNGQTSDDVSPILKLYTDGTDELYEIERDGRIELEASAAEQANKFLDTYKNGIQTISMRIVDSNLAGGYDIESIQVGDTCKVLNVSDAISLPTNGVITSIDYYLDYVEIEVADVAQYTARLLLEQSRKYAEVAFAPGLPDTYTT